MVSIPVLLTNETKRQLGELGHTDEEISAMTPQEGWQTLLCESALQLSKLGWYVFPCVPGEKRPLTKRGFKDATRDPKTIRDWWAKHPLANIGVDCGRSKLAVVDLDVKNGADGPGEWANLGIDDTGALEQETPSGGIHKIWRTDNGIKSTAGKLGPGIDTRGEGGYIVVAPSRTPEGSYTWEASSHPADQVPGSLPTELADLLKMNGHKPADVWESASHPEAGVNELPEHITEGERNVRLTSLAGKLRRTGLDAQEMLPSMLKFNQTHCEPPLEAVEVEAIAESIERYPPGNVPATEPPTPRKESILLRADASDEGNARCIDALYQGQFLHVEAFGWMAHQRTHWGRELAESRLDRAIVDVLTRRRLEAVQNDREAIVRTTRATATNVRNCKYLFESLVPARASDFDSFPDLLNCKNGVLNLRTGDLVAHLPGQRFTYCLPIEYDPKADHSRWRALLLEWTGGDPQLVDFLQSAIGYTLTGHTSEECLFYLYGPTRSGKGSFTETILHMLGKEPLATEVDFSSFTMDRSHDSQNFDLAGLKPCRFVAASESSKYTSLNTARVKAITGGNEIRAAFKRKDHFTYRPQFKVWLSSNYPANADVDDDAIWYRLRVIQFPNSYAGREDKTLKRQLKERESLQGVLAWAVKGAIRWYNQEGTGLRAPKSIQETTANQRLELDYVGQWLDECIEVVDPTKANPSAHFVPNSALYLSYQEWCKENGVTPKHKRSLSMELRRKGLITGAQKKNALGQNQKGVIGIRMI